MEHGTVIIGGGIAGLSCALEFRRQDRDFLVISDTIGGRVRFCEEHNVNYGAYFVMSNYHNAVKILKKQKWLNPFKITFHDDNSRSFTARSIRMGLVPGLLRLVRVLLVFNRHYTRFNRLCLRMSQTRALETDPFLAGLYSTSASDFIAGKKLQPVVDEYVSKFIYACTLTSFDTLSAFNFLVVSLGLVLPMYKFSFDEKAMAGALGKNLVKDTVKSLKKTKSAYIIKTASGRTFRADTVVMATPAAVTRRLIGLNRIKKTSAAYVFHLRGTPKNIYGGNPLNLFSSSCEISALTKEDNGTCLVFARKKRIDLNRYFSDYTLIRRIDWDRAMYVIGTESIEQNFGNSLFVIGDHNILGLEPACISGLYAAQQIISNG